LWILRKWDVFRNDGKWTNFTTWLLWEIRSFDSYTSEKRKADKRQPDIADRLPVYGRKVGGRRDGELPANDNSIEGAAHARCIMSKIMDTREGAVLLRRAMGYEQQEIGDDLGISRQRVQQLESRGRANLAKVTERRKPTRVAA
jgi:DNA-directed RNA polymerase specialized sigma24 family protein